MDNNRSLSRRIRDGGRRGFLGRRSRVLNRRPQVYHPIVPYNSLHPQQQQQPNPQTTTTTTQTGRVGGKEKEKGKAGYQVRGGEREMNRKNQIKTKKKKWKKKLNEKLK
jgi:hypothetical protein